jgi:hypothetical protein
MPLEGVKENIIDIFVSKLSGTNIFIEKSFEIFFKILKSVFLELHDLLHSDFQYETDKNISADSGVLYEIRKITTEINNKKYKELISTINRFYTLLEPKIQNHNIIITTNTKQRWDRLVSILIKYIGKHFYNIYELLKKYKTECFEGEMCTDYEQTRMNEFIRYIDFYVQYYPVQEVASAAGAAAIPEPVSSGGGALPTPRNPPIDLTDDNSSVISSRTTGTTGTRRSLLDTARSVASQSRAIGNLVRSSEQINQEEPATLSQIPSDASSDLADSDVQRERAEEAAARRPTEDITQPNQSSSTINWQREPFQEVQPPSFLRRRQNQVPEESDSDSGDGILADEQQTTNTNNTDDVQYHGTFETGDDGVERRVGNRKRKSHKSNRLNKSSKRQTRKSSNKK